jgi:hypothetical protein
LSRRCRSNSAVVLAGAKSAAEGAATERAVAGTDATFAALAARDYLEGIEPDTINAIYEMSGQQEVELPGLEGVLATIKKGVPK